MIRRASILVTFACAMLMPAPAAQAHDQSCMGVGPALPTCGTGEHVRAGEFIQIGPDMETSSAFTGTIVNFLQSPSGNVKHSCDFILGQVQGCYGDVFNTWPEVGESFTHTCQAYVLGTEIYGGIGPWGCVVRHA